MSSDASQTSLGAAYTVSPVKEASHCCVPHPLLEIRDLAVSFQGRRVLGDVTVDSPRGCITALIGPSGCGKTTFLSTLNRMTDLLDECEVQGEIRLEGLDIRGPDVDVLQLRRYVGMVFQRPNPFPLSIRRNLDMPLREIGIRSVTERRDRIEAALRRAALWDEVADRLDAPALSLSGGQQQRLCIARAIAMEPKVLLMDEPCSALDPLASRRVEELIAELQGDYSIVVVTHNLAQARRIANYAGFFWLTEKAGNLVEFGQCQRLFDAPRHAITAAYISGATG